MHIHTDCDNYVGVQHASAQRGGGVALYQGRRRGEKLRRRGCWCGRWGEFKSINFVQASSGRRAQEVVSARFQAWETHSLGVFSWPPHEFGQKEGAGDSVHLKKGK